MKVTHVLTDSNVGGAGILLESLLRHTALAREDITVILPQGAAMAVRYASLGVRVLPFLSAPDRSFAPRDLPALVRFLRADPPDVLHTRAALSARVAAALACPPQAVRIATRHCAYPVGADGARWRRLCNRAGERWLTDCTVATARAALDNLVALGIPSGRIRLIRNGAEALIPTSAEERRALRRSLGIPQDAFVCGMSARLAPVKGHKTLLLAAKRLLSRHTGYHFLLVGGGSEEARLRALAEELGIGARVSFVGFLSDVGPYVNLFDLAINCSVGTETSCLALSEAMSLGIPCVVSRFGGNPEMVREGENGMLFPPEGDAALAAAIERAATDPVLYKTLAEGARTRYEGELRAERMAAQYDALYAELVTKKQEG